jgi:aubergine-like protein
VLTQPNWLLYQYHVDFSPQIESRRMRSGLLHYHAALFDNKKAFDGSTLYSLKKLPDDVSISF